MRGDNVIMIISYSCLAVLILCLAWTNLQQSKTLGQINTLNESQAAQIIDLQDRVETLENKVNYMMNTMAGD